MEQTILGLLRFLGSIALFLYGMRMMSEALLKIGGARTKGILARASINKFTGLLTGIVMTALIQSSSATSIMVVNYVNAGLISLSNSISIIMGANIGTTVTGWLIAIFGFQLDVIDFALPAIGVALPLTVSKLSRHRAWGKFIVGIALLFIGLGIMRTDMPSIEQWPRSYVYVQKLAGMGLLSAVIFIVLGALITVFNKSSSTTMALTIVLCMHYWIPFEMGAMMIMGENIGTTITANIAAAEGNIASRRAARAHFLFNLIGVIWALILFEPFLQLIDNITNYITGYSIGRTLLGVPVALALFHTLFNLFNALILIWFTDLLLKIVMKMCPARQDEEEEFHLRFISAGLLATPEQSLNQARKEVVFFAHHTSKMFTVVKNLIFENKNGIQFQSLVDGITNYEAMSDQVEREVANYLLQLNKGKTTEEVRTSSKIMFRIINELENITDGCYKLTSLRSRMRKEHFRFPIEITDKLQILFSMTEDALCEMCNNLEASDHNLHTQHAITLEARINEYRDQLRAEHLENLRRGVYTYEVGSCFVDMVEECENVGDYISHVSDALAESESK